jgi:DNA-binding XRE family transcriptional regulator
VPHRRLVEYAARGGRDALHERVRRRARSEASPLIGARERLRRWRADVLVHPGHSASATADNWYAGAMEGWELREHRRRAGLTLRQVARAAGTSETNVYAYERGATRITRDLDAVFEPKREIYVHAAVIAREHGLPEDWVNDSVKGLCPTRWPPVDGTASFSAPGIHVGLASADRG